MRGLEEVTTDELRALGARNIRKAGSMAVSFDADQKLMMRCNLALRTALGVLKPILSFHINSADELYQKVRECAWEEQLDVDATFRIDSAVHSRHFGHTKFAALKTKDAIVDRFRDRLGRRPSVDRDNPHIIWHLHILRNLCTISLDSSGDSLHRRGYRPAADTTAPLSEVLAAGMLRLAGWPGTAGTPEPHTAEPGHASTTLIDPMCGSGTIAIEAALMLAGGRAAPARKLYGFMNWKDFDQELFERTVADLERRTTAARPVRIIASDRSQRALDSARAAARMAGVEDRIEFRLSSFEDLEAPHTSGLLLLNPPYGERIKVADIERDYKQIGDTFKNNWAGWTAWMISSNKEALKAVGLQAQARHTLFNGSLECSFRRYDLYRGSRTEKPDPWRSARRD